MLNSVLHEHFLALRMFLTQAVDTVLHFLLLMMLPAILLFRATEMQYIYSQTMAPLDSTPVMWYNLLDGEARARVRGSLQ